MLRAQRSPLVRSRRGNALAVTAVGLIPILGVLAIVLDGGLLMIERRHAQAVADAAAYAAAGSLYKNYATDQGLDPTGSAKKVALSIAALNGYANDGVTSTVTVNIPPQSGTFKGKSGYVEVIVSYNLTKCFSALWGAGTMTAGASSVGRGYKKTGPASILVLDPTGQQAFNLSGGSSVVTDGNVVVDSNSSKALVSSGTAQLTAPEIDITGNQNLSGGATISGTVHTGTSPLADPLASLPPPDPSTLTVQSTSPYHASGGSLTLYPGVYHGGITLSGANVTLMPGIYYMQGGGLAMSSDSSLSGTGVMIYNDNGGGNLKLVSSGTINLTPPTSGPYAGIVIYQDRRSTERIDLSGAFASRVTGTIYAAGAMLNLTGQSGSTQLGSQLISYDLSLSGGVTLKVTSGNPSENGRVLNIAQ
jgi:Flp pilus assembly protein TadG